MTDKFDERKYIHPLVQAILDEKRISRKDYVLLGPLAFASFERLRDEWEEAGRPLFTDEAKAVLNCFTIKSTDNGTKYSWQKMSKIFAAIMKFKSYCDACYIGREIPHLQRPGPLGDEACELFMCPYYQVRTALEGNDD